MPDEFFHPSLQNVSELCASAGEGIRGYDITKTLSVVRRNVKSVLTQVSRLCEVKEEACEFTFIRTGHAPPHCLHYSLTDPLQIEKLRTMMAEDPQSLDLVYKGVRELLDMREAILEKVARLRSLINLCHRHVLSSWSRAHSHQPPTHTRAGCERGEVSLATVSSIFSLPPIFLPHEFH